VTWNAPEERIVSPTVLGSPREIFSSFHSLWFDRALLRNLLASLWRVAQGFGLAAAVGVPLGVLAGTWPRLDAFLAPLSVFGRNVPVSALVPLTLIWFGIGQGQKVMFIFVATVMFVFYDSARAIASVHERYVETALTLGAKSRQVVLKVLVPLALPEIFGSLRLLFGVAFGYIILAEMVNMENGVGALILVSQRRGPMEHVYLALAAITVVAFGLDRSLTALGRILFPWREQ
jgi:NitT/TauT family transport system permease protein